ncbi:MAG: efflux RND transporter periplasmic adaptor subunit [Melioribacteraceae bacterium]|nr:efflux RND transporter periplasmic adaptor subunit [Melioribacteraceae bacterium]MCF8264911.1 efflux RND transporter periplasmic adaptor subunit [Melioribacteraceae bacterium]MCF8413604.1 efflux RND transporter periplasmic adaptor subunit [Melioribacteraceae bacterium]MCF8430729.1 efflux RND transporter periplasmic adaptor subunit [Melioribacteraceae bacterium]
MKITFKFYVYSLVIIMVVSGAIYILSTETKEIVNESSKSIQYEKLDDIEFEVKTSDVIKGEFYRYVNASGLVKANKELLITSNINGIVDSVNIYEGKKVNKGDLLIKLDDQEHLLAVDDAEVRVTEAKVEYGFLIRGNEVDSAAILQADEIYRKIEKLESDYKRGIVSEEEYLTKMDELELGVLFTGARKEELILNKSGLTSAINSFKRAKINLAYTKIKAPFSGAVGNVNMVAGQRISAGEELFKLLDTDKIKIELGILENDVSSIKEGNKALISIPSLQNIEFVGQVKFISPFIDNETRVCKAIVIIDNRKNIIKPGMAAEVRVETERQKDQTLVPVEAVLFRDNRTLVFTVENDFSKWKYVTLGERNEKYYQIFDGITPGENVIIDGHFTLGHDSKVKIVPASN